MMTREQQHAWILRLVALGLLLYLLSSMQSCHAFDELDIGIGRIEASHHFSNKEYNEVHGDDGLCVRVSRFLGCQYTNSFEDVAVLVGWREMAWYRYRRFDLGTTLAYVEGYDSPMVWASIDAHLWVVSRTASLNFSFLPGELINEVNVVAVGWEIDFD